jgi:type I restriction enzyme S subunit
MTPQELKASILQLAVQGKLVEQRPDEGTGDELYRTIIFTEKKTVKPISGDEIPFDIPSSWKWLRHNELFEIVGGSQPPKSKFVDNPKEGYVRLYQIRDYGEKPVPVFVPRNLVSKFTKKGDILLARYGASVGKVFWAEDGAYNVAMAKSMPLFEEGSVLPAFVYYYYLAPLYQRLVRNNSRSAQAGFNKEDLNGLLFPLPPFEEQKRIVAKIEELLPYIDRYEQAWSKLENFNKRFPVDMQKTILQLAIQGKLVEQRPEEGTGEELYRQIQAEKQVLVKAGKIKKEKPLPDIAGDEIPFDIPASWKWVRLIDLCKSISDGDHQPPPQVPNGIPFLVISNVSSGAIDFSNTRYVPKDYFGSLSDDRVAENGDILFTVTGSYGIPVKVNCNEQFCFQRHIALLKLLIDWDYLYYVLKSPVIKSQCDATATGTAQKTVGLKSLRSMLLPLPPLAEQKRIVAKLEEILPLCERLK